MEREILDDGVADGEAGGEVDCGLRIADFSPLSVLAIDTTLRACGIVPNKPPPPRNIYEIRNPNVSRKRFCTRCVFC